MPRTVSRPPAPYPSCPLDLGQKGSVVPLSNIAQIVIELESGAAAGMTMYSTTVVTSANTFPLIPHGLRRTICHGLHHTAEGAHTASLLAQELAVHEPEQVSSQKSTDLFSRHSSGNIHGYGTIAFSNSMLNAMNFVSVLFLFALHLTFTQSHFDSRAVLSDSHMPPAQGREGLARS